MSIAVLILCLYGYSSHTHTHTHARTHRKKWIKESEGELKLGNQRKERKKKNWIRAITELFSVFCKIVSGSLKTKLEQLLCRRNERTNRYTDTPYIYWPFTAVDFGHPRFIFIHKLWCFIFFEQITQTHTHSLTHSSNEWLFYPNLIENVCECFFLCKCAWTGMVSSAQQKVTEMHGNWLILKTSFFPKKNCECKWFYSLSTFSRSLECSDCLPLVPVLALVDVLSLLCTVLLFVYRNK